MNSHENVDILDNLEKILDNLSVDVLALEKNDLFQNKQKEWENTRQLVAKFFLTRSIFDLTSIYQKSKGLDFDLSREEKMLHRLVEKISEFAPELREQLNERRGRIDVEASKRIIHHGIGHNPKNSLNNAELVV